MKKSTLKFLSVFICALLIFLTSPIEQPKTTYGLTCGEFEYVLNGTKATITGYTGKGGDVIFPSTVDGFEVEGLGADVFLRSACLKNNITIPSSITNINVKMFDECYEILKIDVDKDNPVYFSEDGILYDKLKTTLIRYPNGRANTAFTIPNSIKTIGEGAFFYSKHLTSVTIPKGVTKIDNLAFTESALTSVIIPDSVTTIGDGVFKCCASLTNVDLPDSITSIGSEAFLGCEYLTAVRIPNGVTNLSHTFCNCYRLVNVTLPDRLTNLGEETFYGCYNLKDITWPSNLNSIGTSAFAFCSSLTNVEIPNSVTTIGIAAFSYCSNLATLTLSNKLASIGGWAFTDCRSLTSFTFPNTITEISESLFQGCTSLVNVSIPNSVTYIRQYAFSSCSSLKAITIPRSVTRIGDYAFSSCSSLSEVTILCNDPYLDGTTGHTFYNCPSNLKFYCIYGSYGFWSWDGYKSIPLYLVTYNDNICTSGTVPIDSNTYLQGASVTVLDTGDLAKAGYSFLGWNTKYDGSGTNYKPGETFLVGTDNVTLYANWAINNYTVTFDSQGGSKVDSLTLRYNSTIPFPEPPVKMGYKFDGWYKEPGCINPWDILLGTVSSDITLYAKWTSPPLEEVRYAGGNRFETAVEVSKSGWLSSSDVVLANAYGFADALTGVPFAYIKDAPILLTEANVIPAATRDEMKRLGARNVYILGGVGVVSQEVEDELRGKGYFVYRLAGSNRFETALQVGNAVLKNNQTKTAILTTAYNYPDALAISSYAAMKKYPIIFTEAATLNSKTKEFIKNNGITNIIISGGVGAVSENVEKELKNSGIAVERIAGTDRYNTACNIVSKYKASFKNSIMIATGTDFPDALAGGVLAAKRQIPILLVSKDYVKDEVKNYIYSNCYGYLYVLGGTGVIPDSTVNKIMN